MHSQIPHSHSPLRTPHSALLRFFFFFFFFFFFTTGSSAWRDPHHGRVTSSTATHLLSGAIELARGFIVNRCCCGKMAVPQRYSNQLISAAQVFRHLSANCAEHKPCHEAQVRPLVGLTFDQAQAAWNKAVKSAPGQRITARTVVRAIHELQIAPPLRSRPMQSYLRRFAGASAAKGCPRESAGEIRSASSAGSALPPEVQDENIAGPCSARWSTSI